MIEEIWKIIEEFPLYSVSNKGRIKNNKNDYILVGGLDRDGYRQVTLQKENTEKQFCRRVCRLVAKAFIDNPNNYPVVNHKDENKSNDNIDNLEWCTVKYNNNYGNKNNTLRKKVKCLETNQEYAGTREAERQTNICHTLISFSCRTQKSVKGLHWQYI